jgi:L,D-transpeptidase YcbB
MQLNLQAVQSVIAGTRHFGLAAMTALLLAVLGGWSAATAAPAALPEKLQVRVGALADDPRAAGQPVADPWFLARFYERREFTPAWASPAKLETLLVSIENSARHGLEPADYHHEPLMELVAALREEPSAGLAVELDLLATDALARLALHLRLGKVNPEQIHPSWNFTRDIDGMTPVTVIRQLLRADDLAAALEAAAPDSEFYHELMAFLAAYREIRDRGGWPQMPGGETLRPGMRSPRVPVLREILEIVGDLPAAADAGPDAGPEGGLGPDGEAADPELFDEALDAAVSRFQRRHGLAVDGAVGRQTLAALNVPVETRIDQLRVNLERIRWVLGDIEPRFLLVNIARFRVVLIEDQRVVWSTRAVVGRPYRQTPVFKARMTYLEFNPTWTVPPTILRQDLLPDIRRDPGVLQRRNMSVIDHQGRRVDPETIDWSAVTARTFPYMIRQEPGPDNALGRVKLMYPNPYHVYMHDTPSRELFARPARTFSSGCIRLEDPFALVRILLAGTQWDDEAIERVLESGRTRVVNLPRPISVLTLYGTAVPERGEIHFADDVYHRDGRLLAALDAPFAFSPPAGYDEALRRDAPAANDLP